jgi:hypothetical protein
MFDISAYLPFEAFVAIGIIVCGIAGCWGADKGHDL